MAVENKEVIDFIGIDTLNRVSLTISDELKWDNEEKHLIILQDKINAYLDIIEEKQIYDIYPDAIGKKFIIEVAMKFKPTKKALKFFDDVKSYLKENNYDFNFYHLE